MSKRIVLVGASPEMLGLCQALGFSVMAVCDPALDGVDYWRDIPVFSDDRTCIERLEPKYAALAIDLPASRSRAQRAYRSEGVEIISLLGGRVGQDVVYGIGLVTQFQTNLSEGSTVGEGVRVNIGANIMHEATIEDFVTVAPNATILGRVTIGRGSYIGANATVLPGVSIGANAIVGAGSVVVGDVDARSTVKGVPAK